MTTINANLSSLNFYSLNSTTGESTNENTSTNTGTENTNSDYGDAVEISLSTNAELSLEQIADGETVIITAPYRPIISQTSEGGASSFSGWADTDGGISDGHDQWAVSEQNNEVNTDIRPYYEKPFNSIRDAVKEAVNQIEANPQKNNKELGFFVNQVGDEFYLTKIIEGKTGDKLGYFTRNDVPEDAVAFIHTHPRNGFERDEYDRNTYPSESDMDAWRFFEEVTENSQFEMWIMDPYGILHQFTDEDSLKNISDYPRPAPPTDLN